MNPTLSSPISFSYNLIMPPTPRAVNAALGICLEGNHKSYAPGDVISGYVYRKIHIVSPNASLRLALHGRSKSKITTGGKAQCVYRGRFAFLEDTHLLYEGPLHVEAGTPGLKWPFAITIPLTGNRRNMHVASPDESYLPLGAGNEPNPPLSSPPSFSGQGLSTNMDAFAEFYLQASLRTTSQGSTKSLDATPPVTIHTFAQGPPIAHFELQREIMTRSLALYRLAPGMETTHLSFSQKTRTIFKPSKVPRLAFRLSVDIPSILQLENPTPILFYIQAHPIRA